MRTLEEILRELQRPGIPGSAKVSLRFSNGIASQEQQTALTLQELRAVVEAARHYEIPITEHTAPSLKAAEDKRPICWCGHNVAAHVHAALGGVMLGCRECDCHKYRSQRAKAPEAPARTDDRRESDRHPPRPL